MILLVTKQFAIFTNFVKLLFLNHVKKKKRFVTTHSTFFKISINYYHALFIKKKSKKYLENYIILLKILL